MYLAGGDLKDWVRKEVGCRRHSTTSVGRTKVSVKLVTKKKVQKKHRLYFCPDWHEITSIAMSQASWFWKEDGCRTDSSILDGQTKANAKDAAKKRERRGTDYIIAQAGMKSDVGFQRPAESGSKKVGLQRRNGSGKE